jgi:small subunit ribosomal protein S10e
LCVCVEGVLVAHKDMANTTHSGTGVANVAVVNLMKSLISRELVRQTFNWSHHYYYLLPEGIEYLREYLHLPEEIVPATLKNPRGAAPRERRPDGGTPLRFTLFFLSLITYDATILYMILTRLLVCV